MDTEMENITILSEEEFWDGFALEPIEEEDILKTRDDIEKAVIKLCEGMGRFYDNLNLQKIAKGELLRFLQESGLKTKRDVYLYFLYRDSGMRVSQEIFDAVYTLLLPFYRIKQCVDDEECSGEIRLIDGNGCLRKHALGYCHYKKHKGYMTKALLKEHECLKKSCPLLEKFENRPFWIQREEAKRLKKETMEAQKAQDELLVTYKKAAEQYVQQQGYKLVIVKVSKRVGEEGYWISFVTDVRQNEEVKYFDVAKALKEKFHQSFRMRKVVHPNGTYATISSFNKIRR